MNENPQDRLEWLLSERLDRALSADESAELAKALAADASGVRSARAFNQLDALLKRWASAEPQVDWQALKNRCAADVADAAELAISEQLDRRIDASAVAEIGARVAGTSAGTRDAYARTEAAIRGWRAAMPPVNWEALKLRISAGVAQEAALAGARAGRVARTRQWRWVAQVAAPLAAAAAVAFAIFWPTPESTNTGVVRPERRPIVVVELETPVSSGRVAVRFDPGQLSETPSTSIDVASPSDVEGAMVIAASPPADWNMESPEDAFYY